MLISMEADRQQRGRRGERKITGVRRGAFRRGTGISKEDGLRMERAFKQRAHGGRLPLKGLFIHAKLTFTSSRAQQHQSCSPLRLTSPLRSANPNCCSGRSRQPPRTCETKIPALGLRNHQRLWGENCNFVTLNIKDGR